MFHVISEPTPRGPIYLVEDTTTHTRKRGSFDCERSAQAFADYLNQREKNDGGIISEAQRLTGEP